uniref:ABC-type xenobiotic transporter n=1 Tax=Strigamia maritima TaxID=126957 RepID=T1ILP4_STRMM
IKNPAILLLDEATSALDNESETKILDFLTRADCGRTVITIAHRLSSVRTVDRIIGIKDGRVVEQGTPHELIEAKGLYYQLLQVLGEKDPVDEVNTQNERRCLSKQQHNFLTNDYHQVINNDNTEKDSNGLSANKSQLYRLFRAIVKLCKNDILIFVGIVFMSILYVCCLLARPFTSANLQNLIIEKSYYSHDRDFAFWAGLIILTAICISLSFIIKLLMQSIAEENLLLRIQQRSLAEILRQEVGWFDEPAHNIGNLCSLMMIDAENVKKIPGAIFGSWVFTSLAFTVMITFGLWFQWKLALAIGVMNIVFFLSYYAKEKLDRQILLQRDTADTRANNLAIEAIRNVPTVVSQHIQHLISDKYNKLLGATNGYANMLIHKRALAVASADAFCFLALTIATSYGGYLMSCNELNYIEFQTINSLLINNMWEVIIAFSSIPSFSKACTSAIRLVELFDRKPLNDPSESAGIQLSTAIRPKIEFCDVGFSYPTSPTDKILNHFNLVIDRGEKVAFIGASGCGKTTCVQLLQRFYDPIDGKVTLNGYDVRSFNISFLRSLIGYVPQEPVLFSRSIGENIAYGNNERKIEIYEIIEAAKTANIHEFITSLQEGYDTLIGARGVELSGGQKQRVAIARALVKKPKILLLDEATSALDNDSEKAVQQSLEKVMKDRTCIIVAHRLSTIQNADKIVVFSQGKIVEIGSPQQLLATKGTYYELLHAQSHKELN